MIVAVQKESDGSWVVNSTFGLKYESQISNSTDIRQEVLFNNSFNLTIISADDPYLKFKEITHDKLYLDEDPTSEMILGILVLLVWGCTAALFTHRIWRHIKHHTFRDYFRERRHRQYLEKEKSEEGIDNSGVAAEVDEEQNASEMIE